REREEMCHFSIVSLCVLSSLSLSLSPSLSLSLSLRLSNALFIFHSLCLSVAPSCPRLHPSLSYSISSPSINSALLIFHLLFSPLLYSTPSSLLTSCSFSSSSSHSH